MGFATNYLESNDMTYQQAVMVDNSAPGYPKTERTLAPSTIHRWITTLGRLTRTSRTALLLLLQENPVSSICRDLARIIIPNGKFKTNHRKTKLIGCRQLLMIEAIFKATFNTSIFTKLATRSAFK